MPELSLRKLPPGLDSFGAVMLLLSRLKGYELAHFGPLARAVSLQIERGSHVGVFSGNALIGYAGGLPVEQSKAELWLKGEGTLTVTHVSANTNAWSVSVFASPNPKVVLLMLRHLRKNYPRATVYFRRDYADGRVSARKRLSPV